MKIGFNPVSNIKTEFPKVTPNVPYSTPVPYPVTPKTDGISNINTENILVLKDSISHLNAPNKLEFPIPLKAKTNLAERVNSISSEISHSKNSTEKEKLLPYIKDTSTDLKGDIDPVILKNEFKNIKFPEEIKIKSAPDFIDKSVVSFQDTKNLAKLILGGPNIEKIGPIGGIGSVIGKEVGKKFPDLKVNKNDSVNKIAVLLLGGSTGVKGNFLVQESLLPALTDKSTIRNDIKDFVDKTAPVVKVVAPVVVGAAIGFALFGFPGALCGASIGMTVSSEINGKYYKKAENNIIDDIAPTVKKEAPVILGGAVGAFVGTMVAGPFGMVIGAEIGLLVGMYIQEKQSDN